MRFMNTTEAKGVSLIALGLAVAFGQTAAANELDNAVYKITQICSGEKTFVRELLGKVQADDPVVTGLDRSGQNAALKIVSFNGKLQIGYEGVWTVNETTTLNVDACKASVDGEEILYEERLELTGPANVDTLYEPSSTVNEAKATGLFELDEISTYNCTYLFVELSGSQKAQAAQKIGSITPCVD